MEVEIAKLFPSASFFCQDFVEPLESPGQLGGGAILNAEEVKEIFYPLPQLAALHTKMLVRSTGVASLNLVCTLFIAELFRITPVDGIP